MAESGTCNVCSAPCTSCMHFNRLVIGVKNETFSGEAFSDNISSRHSSSKSAVVNPLKKHAFDNLQDTASATSSHELLSENKETPGAYLSVEANHRKSDKDRNESRSSFAPVGMKQELHGVNYTDNDKGSPVVSCSDVSEKPGMKAQLKTERDNNYIAEESLDVISASKGILDDPAELTDVTEPSSESHSGDESEEVVELDVNICDICGDAGREDLLATCSGCSDGAEHTYCMQEKMEKVPKGEWFCEECRFAEKIQKQRDIGDGGAKVQPISRLRSLTGNLSLKLDSKESSFDGNCTEIDTPGTQSRKRRLERVESSTGLKRQAAEIVKDLSAASSSRRLSRDGSFKSGAHEKMNRLCQPSHGTNNVSSPPQTHRGPLSKSNSFNAVSLKSKGNSIDDIPHKQKTLLECSDAQKGTNRHMARSISLKPVHLGRSHTGEPKVIMLSPKSSHAPEMKGFRKTKERLSYDRKKETSMSSSAWDTNRKTTCSENGFVSTDHNNKDSKANQSVEKAITLSKATSHATRSALDVPEKKLNKPHGKDEITSGTRTAEMHISKLDAVLNPDLLPPQEASYQAVKNTDNNLTWSSSRIGKSTSGSNICQQCQEPCTAAHVCMTSSPRLSASDPSKVKIPDDIEKMNPVKAALHAAFLKKSIICKKRRAPDHEQFDEKPIIPNSNGQNALQDAWSGSNSMNSISSAEKKHIQTSFNNNSYVKSQESSIDNISHSSSLPKKMTLHADVSVDGKSITKVLPSHSLPHMCTAPMSAIPLHEYIWQGDFEVNRNCDKVANMHPGFQAHLSTSASPKVPEVVHKLSPRLSLTAIPRHSVWPAQFHETGATEDNIALYFFAKDLESYERYYKILLDNMMTNDLALKGVVNGVEILIFPSSWLPQNSQRWNMLFFMWGVFRAKKHIYESQMAGVSGNVDAFEKPCINASDASPSIPGPPCPVPSIDSKKLECQLIRDTISCGSSSCNLSLSKRRPPNSYEEEHVVDMECEVKPKPSETAVTDRPAMPGSKSSHVLKSSVSDFKGEAGPDGVSYFGNDEKEVHRVTVEGNANKDDNDVKPSLKKGPFMKDGSVKDFEFGLSYNKNRCHVDSAKISCPDSDIDRSKTQLTSCGSKDVKMYCPTSEAQEASPGISSKKIMYDLNLDARDMIEETGTAECFLTGVESPQLIGANPAEWDLNSSASDVLVDGENKDRQDTGYGRALCADTESFPLRNGALPLFVEGGAGKKEETPAASLSLSLAIPFMDDKPHSSSKQATGKPPFLLFGGFTADR